MASLDDAFDVLDVAIKLDEKGDQRVEAATKYYEAVYLMKRFIQRLPELEIEKETKSLIQDKIQHYERIAKRLMSDETSIRKLNPRSPVQGDNDSVFFDEVPLVPCIVVAPSDHLETEAVDTVAAKANRKLSTAIDLDEANNKQGAIAAYTEAVELYLEALQAVESSNQSSRHLSMGESLKKRIEQALDRMEKLKRAPTVEVLTRVLPSRKKKPPPMAKSSLTAEEVEILTKSSQIASGIFLPWNDKEASTLSSQHSTTLFTDPDGKMALSSQQKARFHKWARPAEICYIRHKSGVSARVQKPVALQALSPYNIRQQCVTDCSFIASLCICASFERRFQKQLITSILHPQNAEGLPVYNTSGKYMVKLWLNGVARRVVIDDYLPIDKHGNLLCSITTETSHPSHLELWVCLIEKAYMKLCGGYDFPGSNSGYDLFSLTGWIPERILFAKDPTDVKDFETHPDRVFQRIFSANCYGDCLITVSTQNELSLEEAEKVGLVTGHAYAVLSVIQTLNGTKLLQLKNPWARKGWKGQYSPRDNASWTPALAAEVGYNPTLAAKQDDGIFWISWGDILRYFQNFHLSWTPSLLKYRSELHGFWPKSRGPVDDTFNVSENPQYIVQLSDAAIEKKATLWILVSRHVAKQEQEGQEAKDFLTIHLHRNDPTKSEICYPGRSGNCILTGAYTNNPHVLIRYDVSGPEDRYLSLVLSQYKKSNDLSYTLACYSTEVFTLGKPRAQLPCSTTLSASLTPQGGPMGSEFYQNNPMFAINMQKAGTLQLNLSTNKSEALHALLVPVRSFGDPVSKASGEAVVDSGKYRHGFVATSRTQVKAGSYVLVISRFCRTQVTCKFHVTILSSTPLKTKNLQKMNGWQW